MKQNLIFIGCGNMAQAIIKGIVQTEFLSPQNIIAIDPNLDHQQYAIDTFNIQSYLDISDAKLDLDTPKTWVLAVKPQMLKEALSGLSGKIQNHDLIISVAAGINTTTITKWLNGPTKLVRSMPNTPAIVLQGMTALYASEHLLTDDEFDWVSGIFKQIGKVIWVQNEGMIDAVTAISGSGPAYVFYMIEHLMKAAQELGFDQETARELVTQTFSGSSNLAQTSTLPISTLRENVTSKGGTTAAALEAFAVHQLPNALYQGVHAAHTRAISLSDELSN